MLLEQSLLGTNILPQRLANGSQLKESNRSQSEKLKGIAQRQFPPSRRRYDGSVHISLAMSDALELPQGLRLQTNPVEEKACVFVWLDLLEAHGECQNL